MISVKLSAWTNVPPSALAAYAAMICYRGGLPDLNRILAGEYEKVPDVGDLFEKGHHTTLEHTYFTFTIEGVDIGDVDFGLHVGTPYYNTDQRSGRYARMFEDPNAVAGVVESIAELYPELTKAQLDQIGRYLERCLAIYHSHEEEATALCLKLHEEERPFLSDALRENMKKLAQEQLRAFIPVAVPTGLAYTIDTITLASLYHAAWSPVMRRLTDLMVAEVLEVYPDLGFCFGERQSHLGDYSPKFKRQTAGIIDDPWAKIISIEAPAGLKVPDRKAKHPLDLTTVHPSFMLNDVGTFLAEIEVSLMTFGQDQRHRGIRRSEPVFTGNFILTPMLTQLGLRKEAMEVMESFLAFSGMVPDSLLAVLAPYGSSVTYFKRGGLNALAHEQGKRLCFCAQRDIYEPNRQLREQIEANPEWRQFLQFFEPPCMHGSCAEPDRYCGRDMKAKDRYFPYRTV